MVTPTSSHYGRTYSNEARHPFRPPLSSNGTSPLTSHSKIGPGSSFSAAMKPSTETDAFMTTFPMDSSFVGVPSLVWRELLLLYEINRPGAASRPRHGRDDRAGIAAG